MQTNDIITSKENQLYKYITLLTVKKGRDSSGEFIIEGAKFVQEALEHCEVVQVAVSETFAGKNPAVMTISAQKISVFADSLFNALAVTENTGGILAVCKKFTPPVDFINNNKPDKLYLIAEEISDPGNLGALIRVADAAGADAVVLSSCCVELYNPKVLRGSAGSVFHLPVIEDVDMREVIWELKSRGVRVYAAMPAGAMYPYGLDLRGSCAFVLGSEANGLKWETAELADAFVKLPMPGKAESLNAAVAAGVLLYEAVRQRLVI
ncbi:MAG: RNA methyltransferase [Defluviitaleaceae bacterium]|nr:RNA methyltransferase [Defluviitaleaceae bacterium]MCL2837210.1 RNA methyltransferase [Defluviitaleaceae bacterium]